MIRIESVPAVRTFKGFEIYCLEERRKVSFLYILFNVINNQTDDKLRSTVFIDKV